MLLIGASVAWARLFLGVHFPFDMLGSAAAAAADAVNRANLVNPSILTAKKAG